MASSWSRRGPALPRPQPRRAADHKSAPPAKPAAEYAANDTHPDEHVTIAAEPCDDPKQCPFFRLPYIQHGLLPIRVIITNDCDRALSLDEPACSSSPPTTTRFPPPPKTTSIAASSPCTAPSPSTSRSIPIPIQRTPVDKKITEDDNDFGFQGTVVNAHSTLAGYLFYDIKDLDEPALKHAELYVKMVHTLDGKQELFAFTIPFDKWLAANPDAPSNHPRR